MTFGARRGRYGRICAHAAFSAAAMHPLCATTADFLAFRRGSKNESSGNEVCPHSEEANGDSREKRITAKEEMRPWKYLATGFGYFGAEITTVN